MLIVLHYYPGQWICVHSIPSQLPGEYTTQAAIQGATRLSFTYPSHPSGYPFSAG